MSSISSVSSLNNNAYASATTSTNRVTVPTNLTQYLSNTESNSKELVSIIKKLYKETNSDRITKTAEKFVKYYNNIISDNGIYDDKGLKALTKEMKNLFNKKSSSLSDLGFTIQNSGKLKLDKSKLETAVSDDDFSKFVSSNKDRGGLFYDIKKLVTNLKEDSTYYLSSTAKQIIQGAK